MQPVAGLIQVCRRRRDGQIRQHASDAPNMGWVQPAAVTALEQASQSRVRYPHWPIIACNTSRCKTITNDLLIELFYPTSTNKQRKRLAFEARKSLAQLVKDGEARIVKGRLMPPKPRTQSENPE